MMIQTQRRVLLSIRNQFHSNLKFNPQISRPNPNSNSRSSSSSISPHQIRHFKPRCLISYNFSPLSSNSSFQFDFNGVRNFATRLAESSNNKPPKETIMLEGCDFEHWLVVVEAPGNQLTRDEIIDGYIKTLAHVTGSEKDARMKIYSVSTRHYYAFGALLSEELAYKLKEQPHVRWVLPDSYFDVKNKTYAGEPFINGEPVPYDPKYHEIWLQNHEHSLRNNVKGNRRQRDPNSLRQRPRSPPSASTHGSPNQNLMPAGGPQSQAPQTSNVPNLSSRLLSSSHPEVPSQNMMPSTGSPNQGPTQSQIPNPTQRLFSQSNPPQLSAMQNHSSPWTSPPPPSSATVTTDTNQNWGNQNQNWRPLTSSHNQTRYPSQMQKPPPPPSPTSKPYNPAWNGQSPSWEPDSGSQSWTPQPPISKNNYSYDNNLPSPAVASDMPSHRLRPDIPGGGMPTPVQQNNYSHRDIPRHLQNSDPQNGYPVESMNHQPYQNSYTDMQRSSTVVSPQRDWMNYQDTNLTPSAPVRDMPSHMQNSGIRGGEEPSHHGSLNPSVASQRQQYQNGYPSMPLQHHQQYQNGYQSMDLQHQQQYRNGYPSMPSQHQQQYQNGYPSMPLQHRQQYQNGSPSMALQLEQQYQNGYPSMALQHQHHYQNGYNRDMQSSNAVVSPEGGWNCQNANLTPSVPPRDMVGYSDRENPGKGFQSHASQHHQYQNASRGLQNSDATGSSQGWNKQNLTPPSQKSSFPNTNMTSQVQNHPSHGENVPNLELAAQQVDIYSGGEIRGNNSSGPLQPRDYQERDLPNDEEYVYAAK